MSSLSKLAPDTPKAKRLSTVALAGAGLAVIWSLVDGLWEVDLPAVFISAVTSFVMLIEGFYDFKHSDVDSYGGEPDPNG